MRQKLQQLMKWETCPWTKNCISGYKNYLQGLFLWRTVSHIFICEGDNYVKHIIGQKNGLEDMLYNYSHLLPFVQIIYWFNSFSITA